MKTVPKPNYALILTFLIAVWMLPGLLLRTPWKADEAYTFGLVLHMVETGDYVVPTLGGEPFMQKPPLFFITAAAFAKVLSPFIDFASAARMANVVFLGITLIFLARAARSLYGEEHAWLAPLIFMGCIGQFHNSHLMITDVALVAGFAVTLYGLASANENPWIAGFWTGTGLGITFMTKGLLGPGLLGLTIILLPIFFRNWRTGAYFISLIIAAIAILPWLLWWPVTLYFRDVELFKQWFLDNNLGRFIGPQHLGRANPLGLANARYNFFVEALWFTIPALPLLGWALWKDRRITLRNPGVQLSLLCLLIILTVLTAARNGRSLYSMPMLAPAALFGAWGATQIGPRFTRYARYVCFGLFGLLIGALWVGWIAQITGQPDAIWQRLHQEFPQLVPQFSLATCVIASVCTAGWLLWMLRQNKTVPAYAIVNWTAGLAMIYLLVMTLYLPLVESNMSYAHLASLKSALPVDHGCIASRGVGEPQRAMFHYYAGVKTERMELDRKRKDVSCDWLLVQSEFLNQSKPVKMPLGDWEEVWRDVHSGKELFRLYRRATVKK